MKKFKKTLAVFTALLMALPLLWAMPTAVLATRSPTDDYARLTPVGQTQATVKVYIGQPLTDNCTVRNIVGNIIYVDLNPLDYMGHTYDQRWQLPYASDLWNNVGAVESIENIASAQYNLHEGANTTLQNGENIINYHFQETGGGGGGDTHLHNFWLAFDANGGTGAPATIYAYSDETYHGGESITIPSQEPTRTGFTFQGWSRTPDGEATLHAGYSVYVSDNQTVTLYAVWQDNTSPATVQYTVKHLLLALNFDQPPVLADTDILYGVPGAQTEAAARTYEGFTNNDFYQDTIAADGSTVITITYQRNVHQLTWDPNGGTITTPETEYTKNGPYDYGWPITAPAVEKEGYTFVGWTPNPVAETMPDNDLTYTAQWQEQELYTVGFAPGGGRPLEGQQHPEEPPKEANDTFNLPPCPYEKPNHTFAGWEYNDHTYQPGAEFTMPAENVVFTATWEPIATSADILGTITVVNPRANKIYNAYRVFDLTFSCDEPGEPPTSYAYSIESDSPWFTVIQTYANDHTHGLKLTQSAADSDHYIVEFAPEANSIPGYGAFDPVDFAAYLRDNRPANAEAQVVAHRNAGPTPTGSIKLTTDGDAPGQTGTEDNYHVPLGYYFVDTGTGTFCGLDSADPDAYIYDKYEVPGWDTQSGNADLLGKVVAAENPYATTNPGSWGKTSDEIIGSEAWFKIMAHVPAYEYGHQIDQYTFTDTLGDGFTYDAGSLKITLYCGLDENGVPIPNPSTVLYDSVANPTHPSAQGVTVTFNGNTITVKLQLTGGNAIDLDGTDGEENYYPDAHIVIEYTAHVDQDAVYDNVNTAKMDWTWVDPNPVPNQPPEPTPDPDQPSPTPLPIPTVPATPADVQTDTYVYGLPFNKTIKGVSPAEYLSGAEFKLYSDAGCTQLINLVAVAENALPTGAPAQEPEGSVQWTYYRVADATETAVAGFASETIEAGRAVIWGLAPGTYYLKETKAPDGYNPLAEPFPITICTGDDPTTTEVTEVKNVGDNGYVSTDTFNVENAAGAELPGVGGIGTTIFYIVGALLMIAAAVLLTVRKKMSVQE